mgnify:CR=1 FL=1|jgi:hypothetical protein
MDAYDGMSLCGGGLAAFGWLRTPWAAVPLMVLLPLLLDLASFYLEERQNHLIDRLDAGRDRAAALSAMNIGVNLAEIASLFASSLLTALGIGWRFALCGGLLLLGALGYMLSSRKITG